MSISAFSGPVVVFGQMSGYPGVTPDYNPELGPSLFFGGVGTLDQRPVFTYTPGQNFGAATLGWLGIGFIQTLNTTPPAATTTGGIAAAAAVSANTPMTLVSTSSAASGVAVSQSIVRSDTGALVTGLLALDAYTSVTGYISNGTSGTAGNVLIVSTNSNLPLTIGMVISGTGIAAGTTITGYGPTVNATNGGSATGFTGSYTISGSAVAVGTSGSPVTITAALSNGTNNAVLSCATPFGSAGTIQLWNPQALSARAVSVTPVSAAPTANITFTVAGYDIYGYPMSEVIALTTGSASGTAVNGKKAFKYIVSVTPSVSDTVTFRVDTTNIFGLPIRSDNFGDILVNQSASVNPAVVTANTGYVAAVTTTATTTTGDVRGTYTFTPTLATTRFVVRQTPQVYNTGSITGLFGVTQA